MKKLWLLLYAIFVVALFLLDFFQGPILLKKIGGLEAALNIMLIFYYIQYKKSRFILKDLYLIEALLFTVTSGVLLLFLKTINY